MTSDVRAHFDVVVIGAGPAGLSTALHLLKLDPQWRARLLVLEKANHPRFKLCGGAVTRLGLNILRGLGFSFPLPVPHQYIRQVQLRYRQQTVTLQGEPQLLIFERARLDAYLVQEARARGIQIREGEPVQAIRFLPEGVIVRTQQAAYFAQAVVGADGANGITRRWARRQSGKARQARPLEVVQPATGCEPLFRAGAVRFDFSLLAEGLQGYVWEFPFSQGGERMLNRGIYDARLAWRKSPLSLPSFLQKAFAQAEPPLPPADWRSHPIHWFSPRARFAYPRLLLVGDAAGVDPLFGEGIGPALAYGQVAAQAIQQAFAQQDFSFRHYRPLLKRSYLGRYLMTRWFTAEVSYRLAGQGWFPPLVWRLGAVLARLFPAPPPLFSPSDAGVAQKSPDLPSCK